MEGPSRKHRRCRPVMEQQESISQFGHKTHEKLLIFYIIQNNIDLGIVGKK
jgi:hypothetical protein